MGRMMTRADQIDGMLHLHRTPWLLSLLLLLLLLNLSPSLSSVEAFSVPAVRRKLPHPTPTRTAAAAAATAVQLRTNKHDDDSVDDNRWTQRDRGLLVLLSVPAAWGSYEPAVRLVYQRQPSIPPFLFSFAYYLVATVALLGGVAAMSATTRGKGTQLTKDDDVDDGNVNNKVGLSTPNRGGHGGLELGTYLFVGNALQVIGLKDVASDRAAFELQLTTIMVPIIQSLHQGNLTYVKARTWGACLVALSGVALIGLDDGGGPASRLDATSPPAISSLVDQWTFSMGDFLIMLGALFYTFHCIRLEVHAKTTPALQLAAAKATTETAWSGLVLGLCLLSTTIPLDPLTRMSSINLPLFDLAQSSGRNILMYWNAASFQSDPDGWIQVGAATMWTGLVTVAYTIAAQSYGQARVPASTANLVYTIQPFFTSVIAYLVLGERLGGFGYAGGALIGAAVFLVVLQDDSRPVDNDVQTESDV